jgi:hypothetical protein
MEVLLSNYWEGSIEIPLGHQVQYPSKMDNHFQIIGYELLQVSLSNCHDVLNINYNHSV